MALVRVPKELRPPKRFGPFKSNIGNIGEPGVFCVKHPGVFRIPTKGDLYWMVYGSVGRGSHLDTAARVILERIK